MLTQTLPGGRGRLVRFGHFVALAVLLVASAAWADVPGVVVPTGRQEYFVLGYEQHLYNMLRRVYDEYGAALASNRMNSVVSVVVSADGQIVTYDHWEDGLEADPWSTSPALATTLVLGDNNPANGRACDWMACGPGHPADGLLRGDALTFASNQTCTGNANVQCYVGIPRAAAAIRFDGGDRIVTSGGPLSIIHDQNPNSPYSGGSTEVLPKQAYAGASSYSIPVGENQYAGGAPAYEFVQMAAIDLVAFEANTQVFINSPGAGTVSFTLQPGQHYTNCNGYNGATFACNQGAIDSVAGAAAAITINAGTKISSTKPVAILLFTAAHGNYATDFMPVLPDLLHGNDYILPSPGDNPAVNGNRPFNIYAYNPDPVNALVVNTTDANGSATLSLAANETKDYSARTCTGACPTAYVPSNSSVRLTAPRNFWGVAIHDHQGTSNDWGYAWLATAFLKSSYTVPYAPGVRDPVAAAAARATYDPNEPRNDPDCRQPPLPPGPGACDSINRAPVFVAAAQDATYVKVDFNNDGVYDIIDRNSDDLPDNGQATDSSCGTDPYGLGFNNCLYLVNALQVLRVYDYTDYDNTGTRVVALGGKPIAMSYGQDTDEATGSDDIQDTGYTVYPLTQRFLDPVLVAGKEVSPTAVSGSGGQATFTLHLQSFAYPLTALSVTDFLPAGLTYVPGSTLITYPNLAQGTNDPVIVDGNALPGDSCPAARWCLTWSLSPDTLATDQLLTVRFTANVAPGPPMVFANEVEATAVHAGRTYRARGGTELVRTDVTLSKLESDDGTPEPGDVVTYTLTVTNHSSGATETNVRITDAIPPGTTYLAGSLSPVPPATFGGVFSPAQNAIVWTAASLGPGASATLSFQVRLNADLVPGTVVDNYAIYQSTETPSFSSNVTMTTVIGPVLANVKTIVGGTPASLHPLEKVTFQVQVTNSGSGSATSLRITDSLAVSNASYVAGSMQYSVNGAAFVPLTDAALDDEGTATGSTLELALLALAPSADVRFRFQARVNPGTGGLFLNNQATVSATQVGTSDTNLVQVPIVGNATVTGRIFRDLDADGTLDAGEPGLANVAILVTDAGTGFQHLVSTDAFGLYSVAVPPGVTRLRVQTATLPPGFTLTTGAPSEDQSLTALANQTISAAAVGYSYPSLMVTKTSSAGGTVVPGQTVTYTVTVTNNSGATLGNVQINDPIPAGASYVAGTAQLTTPTGSPFRVTEYYIGAGPFTDTTYDLTLSQNLAGDFFVIIQPEGKANGTADGPDVNYASVVAAGTGVGDLPALAANQIRLQRGNAANTWAGVVTVIECLQSCTTAGFRLLGAERVAHTGAGASGADTTVAWSDISRVMLVGGANGAGCDTSDTSDTEHKNCHVRLWPSGTNTINWTRDPGGANLTAATSTVMVVQWGSEWTVQRTAIAGGNNGGPDINAAGEYNPAPIAPVLRSATWVWGTGHTDSAGVGDSAEGVALTLGSGANPNPLPSVEGSIAAGVWVNNANVNFDVYALSHPQLAVDYRFRTTVGGLTQSQTVNAASSPRMALVFNGHDDTATGEYPCSLLSARYTAAQPSTTVTLERTRNSGNYAAWVQGIDFGRITGQTSGLCDGVLCFDPQANPNVLPPATYSLPAGTSLTYSYEVRVDTNPSLLLISIDNAATATAGGAGPTSATTSDLLVRPRVDVEPNNAGYAQAGTTITFTHTVTNTSTLNDSDVLTVTGERGWQVDLVDPDTGVVIATDLTADGTWDSGTLQPSTGTLAPGASKEYQVRVWVPSGTPAGIENTVRLQATSSLASSVGDDAKDEITVLSSTLGSVIVTPDNSGVVQANSYTAYAHRVINNTAFADTFDFLAPGLTTGTGVDSSRGWTNTIHWDTNGDGVYTPNVDLPILNTAQLPPGGSQLIFVVVNAPDCDPPGTCPTPPGTRDVSHITAWSRRDNSLFGAATDTSTVVTTPRHDLSGGGSRVVAPGDIAVFPGTIVNLGSAADRFELAVTPSNLNGAGGDGLVHPTQLWADTNSDGVPDLMIAADTNGDGTWDVPPPAAWDGDGDGQPDLPVPGGGAAAYELRRPVGLDQKVQRDYVTLTSRSVGSPTTDPDNVTATWIFAAVTRAGIQGLRVRPGEVAFATSTQSRTASFVLYQTDDPTGATGREALHDQPVVSPVPDSITPILYTVLTRPVERRFLTIEETETDGDTHWTGPFAVGDARLERSLARVEKRLDAAGVPQGRARWLKGYRRAAADPAPRSVITSAITSSTAPARRSERLRAGAGVKIEVARGGQVRIPAADLVAGGLSPTAPGRRLWLTNLGHLVAYSWQRRADGALELVFDAAPLRTDYSDRNVYVLTPTAPGRGLLAPLTRSADPATPGFLRAEREQLYVPSLPVGSDPWQWDILFSGVPWPDPDYDPAAGDFDLPDLASGASGPVPVRVRVVGYTHHRHDVSVSINGEPVGTAAFDGVGPTLLVGTVPGESLRRAGNRLSIAYMGSALPDSPASEAFAYLDYVDIGAPASSGSGPASFSLAPWQPLLPSLQGVEYLVVTHPIFRAQADRMAAEKEADGQRTAVVETTTAYDGFSAGMVEPRAIQALIRFAARASGALRYVLLIGDDSFDPLDHSGRGVPSFVPSLFARDSGWGLVPSENLYADLDDDGLPDVAIGRLPVRTPSQADAMADKIAAQRAELAALGDRHLAVADNSTESDAPFREEAQRALDRMVDGAGVGWADLAEGAAAARAALLAGWQSGALGTHYFGHGGLTEWADEQVLTTDDVAALGSSWRPTTLFTWACLSQYYLGVDGPSLNESLLLQPGGGALASFGPAGITPPARQAALIAHVYDQLHTRGTSLGEAIRRAKVAALAEQPSALEVIEGFNLFGDPALVLYASDPAPR